jgi:cytochrome c biogenesis protein CcmG/thiol:disulfide interchange protein DsbE
LSRKTLAILVILLVAGLVLVDRTWLGSLRDEAPGTRASDEPELMEPVPNIELPARDGNQVNLRSLHGKVVVINFWASWCLPCKLEIPFLNQVYGEFRNQGVEFVAISEDAGGWDDIEEFLRETPIDYPILLDEGEQAAEALGGLPGLPVTIFVDRQGRIAAKHIGITDIDDLRANIRRLL